MVGVESRVHWLIRQIVKESLRQNATAEHVDIPFRDIDAHLMIEDQIRTTHLTRVVANQKPGLCFCVVQVEITLRNERKV